MTTNAKWSDLTSLDSDKTLAAVNQLLPRWVTLLLAAALAWQLSALALAVANALTPQKSIPVAQVAISTTIAAAEGQVDLNQVAASHLFGQAGAEPVAAPVPVETEAVADTRLNLTLKGTIAANESRFSLAIIEGSNREEKVYAINDTVVSGTSLHSVYADRVILNRSGVLEALRLPREFAQTEPPPRQDTTRTIRSANASGSFGNSLAENPAAIGDIIRPTPYFVGGEQQGYRVYPGKDRRTFAKLGLRPGDLVKEIDGSSLTDPTQAMAIFQSLETAGEVSITVVRNGESQVLVLDTSQLDSLDDDE
jgi:general secretion pathway protein C